MVDKTQFEKMNSPEQLNNSIKSTHPITWIALISVIIVLFGFFVWATVAKISYKIKGIASISSKTVTLSIEEKDLSKLQVGQKVVISHIEGSITSINEDGYPEVTNFDLEDGSYDYYIIYKTVSPIHYFGGHF